MALNVWQCCIRSERFGAVSCALHPALPGMAPAPRTPPKKVLPAHADGAFWGGGGEGCLLYTSPSPRD
eukprot:5296392-Alexandrium_andersonii.AAC.1